MIFTQHFLPTLLHSRSSTTATLLYCDGTCIPLQLQHLIAATTNCYSDRIRVVTTPTPAPSTTHPFCPGLSKNGLMDNHTGVLKAIFYK